MSSFEMVKQAAFDEMMGKVAGERSEVVSTLGGSLILPMAVPNLISTGAGYLMGEKTNAEMARQNKAGVSNFIPFVGPYRLGRRIATKRAIKSMTPKEKKEYFKKENSNL
jgi:hypothetical protein